MSTTHFSGPVQSNNGFTTTIAGASTVAGTDSSSIIRLSKQVNLTNFQVRSLFTAPVEIVPPPGLGKAIYIESVILYKPAGTAFTIGSATNLTVGYTLGPALTGTLSVTGFLDQSLAQTRLMFTSITSMTPSPNAGLSIRIATADVTAGTSDMTVVVNYTIIPTVLS